MPFKSKAQRRKFAELLVKGEISPKTFEEWNRETGRKVLPERVAKKTRATKKTRVTTQRQRPLKRATRQPGALLLPSGYECLVGRLVSPPLQEDGSGAPGHHDQADEEADNRQRHHQGKP